jgi:ABC-2 type transport system permease protein
VIPYLKVLIRQSLAGWNPVNFHSSKKSKVGSIVGFVGIMLSLTMLYAMLVGLEYLVFGAFQQLGEPQTMLALTGVLCTMMTVVVSFFYVLSELFFSKDVGYVSALPLSSREILAAKLVRIWLGEAVIALLICLPVAVLYGISQTAGVLYYVKALALIAILPMVPIAVISLLSFVLIRVSALWKRREVMTVVISMLFLVGFMWAEMQFSMSLQEDDLSVAILQLVMKQNSVLDLIAGLYPPIRWFSDALTQGGLAALANGLAFAALGVAALAAIVLSVGGAYQRLAIRQNETLIRLNATARRNVDRHGMRTPFMALYRREIREIFLVPVYAMNCLSTAVMFPLVAVIMMMSAGQSGSELSALPALLKLIPGALVVAVAAGLFALTSGMSMALSTAVSREGVRHEFFRMLPVKPQTQLLAKLAMGLTLNLLTSLPMLLVMVYLLPTFGTELALGYLCALPLSAAASIASLMIDVAHPKFIWKNETEAIKQNGMAAMAMFGSMAFLGVCGFGYYGLTTLGFSYAQALLSVCGVGLLMDAVLLRRLVGKSSQSYILREVQN